MEDGHAGATVQLLLFLLLNAAGPEDVAINLADRTYRLSVGPCYLTETRTGDIDADLKEVYIASRAGRVRFPPEMYLEVGQMKRCTIRRKWRSGPDTSVGTFASWNEEAAHAGRLAEDSAIGSVSESGRFREIKA